MREITMFRSHDLVTQQQAALMERQDTKYLLPVEQLAELLPRLRESHSVLEQQQRRQLRYASLYFDTPRMDCYLAHHNGKLNRYKVRIRHYLDTQEAFVEVKCRTNRRRTIKQRVPCDVRSDGLAAASGFLEEQLAAHLRPLTPTLWVRYKRMTLLDIRNAERLTIDTDLTFSDPAAGVHTGLRELAIIEVKTAPGATGSGVTGLLKQQHIPPVSFSKYCMGLALCSDQAALKRNRFLPMLRRIAGALECGAFE